MTGAIEETPPSSETPSGLTILLVDDDPDLRNLTEMVLGLHGHTVFVADSGQHALDWIEANGHQKIDLIITDLLMPKIADGLDFIRALRSNPKTAQTLIALQTNYAFTQEDLDQALSEKERESLCKSF